ncbi:MAG: hypothetical protein ACOX9C_08120 [Kiritimatiellia bacterium]|jgi:hypothetical protein
MSQTVDPKLLEAIGFFEKMLLTMPGDRTGLEFLSVAYEQTGERDKQISALVKLSETLLKEGDMERASLIAEKLKSFSDSPEAMGAAMVVEKIVAKGPIASRSAQDIFSNELFIDESQPPAEPVAPPAWQSGGIPAWTSDAAKAEMEIVWQWNDGGVIPKDVCMDMLHVFMDHPVVVSEPSLVSALGLLQERHPELADVGFESMQKRSKMPPLPLELFEVAPDAVRTLPEDYLKVKGVLPFGFIANEMLVCVMNGVDLALREEIQSMSNRACHFFLMHPRAWFEVSPEHLGQEKTLG